MAAVSVSVLVVIVNYRTPDLTIECVRSLGPEVQRLPGVRAVVVDNDSGDGSSERIEAAIEKDGLADWCTLIAQPSNGGFAQGTNCGIRAAGPDLPDYVWLLNPDTCVQPGALTELVSFLEAHPDAGIAGGRLVNEDGSVRSSCFRFHSPLGELDRALHFGPVSRALERHVVTPRMPDVPTRTDWVSGASMLVRRAVFERIGLFDEGYFLYFEETDFCRRAARAGFECWYVPESRVVHLAGQSSNVTGAKAHLKRRPRYWFESRKRYFRTHHGPFGSVLADLFFLVGYPIGRVAAYARGKPSADPPLLWWDFLRASVTPAVGNAPRAAASREPVPLEPMEPVPDELLGTRNENPRGLSLLELWREDYETHGRDPLSQGFWAVAVHRFGNWRMGIRSRALRLPFSILYRFLYKWVEWTCGISLAYTVKLGRRVHIWHHGGMILGARMIGNDVHLRQNTTMGVRRRNDPRWLKPIIQDRADIGAGAVIIGGVTIGHDSVVGANSVVSADVPPEHVAIGVPAVVKPKRPAP
jgi:GT2 family glycosyltransferase/serine acetyltransferase